MNILVNASNLKSGGGLQVADSFCRNLNKFLQHGFFVVLSTELSKTKKAMEEYTNTETYTYDIKNNFATLFLGRDDFLDNLVKEKQINFVLTIFGPSRWTPKVKHLSGFAMGQLVLKDSPFYSSLSFKDRLYWKYFFCFSRKILFKRSTKLFYSENPYISLQVERLFKNSKCYTVTNYYNQIFDSPNVWKKITLPTFSGITLLSISSFYPFKNLTISVEVAKILKKQHPNFSFRFVFTCKREDFPVIPQDLKEHFLFLGRADIEECPSLYAQCDMVFMPTLMECFTAVYPEAFKMQKPLLTSDLPFARKLCNEAAEYFSPLRAEDIAEKIFLLSENKHRQKELIDYGRKQLKLYDDYNARVEKIIKIIEDNA